MFAPHTPAPAKRLFRWLAAGLLLVAAAVSPSPLHGQADSAAAPAQYHPLFGNSSLSVFLDTRTVRRGDGDVLTVSTLWQYASRRLLGDTDRWYDASRSDDTFDCATRRYRSHRMQYFLRANPVGSTRNTPAGEWREPAPGTTGEALLNGVCEWAKSN